MARRFSILAFLLSALFFSARPGWAEEAPRDGSQAFWSLLILPDPAKQNAWIHHLSTASPLQFTVALSPSDLRNLGSSKDQVLAMTKAAKLEVAARLTYNPPMALIYDSELALTYLETPLPHFPAKLNYANDIAALSAKTRADFKNFLGDFPKGFVPSDGSVSLPVIEMLKQQGFDWVIAGFPASEWRNGDILNSSTSREKTLWVYSVSPLSQGLHDSQWMVNAAKRGPADTKAAVERMFDEISAAGEEGIIPIVVFDEKRSIYSLDLFLAECKSRMAASSKVRTVLTTNVGYVTDSRKISTSLQIWPYSWTWIAGLGDPRGPGLTAWAGDPAKNNAWKLLAEAREKIEEYKNSGSADVHKLDRALNEIYVAESGDFFEWFGSLEGEAPSTRAILAQKQREKELFFKATLNNIYRHLNIVSPEPVKGVKKSDAFLLNGATDSAQVSAPEAPEEPEQNLSVRLEAKDNALVWTPNVNGEPDGMKTKAILKKFGMKIGGKAFEELVELQFSIQDSQELASCVADLYIDINRREYAGKTDLLPGRGAKLSAVDAWEYALTCQRLPTKDWDCKLYRSSSSKPVFSARAASVSAGGRVVWEVKIPKNLLGKEPLRWGYLSCIMEKEGKPILDFLSPVQNKRKVLQEFESELGSGAATSIVLPMMRAD